MAAKVVHAANHRGPSKWNVRKHSDNPWTGIIKGAPFPVSLSALLWGRSNWQTAAPAQSCSVAKKDGFESSMMAFQSFDAILKPISKGEAKA